VTLWDSAHEDKKEFLEELEKNKKVKLKYALGKIDSGKSYIVRNKNTESREKLEDHNKLKMNLYINRNTMFNKYLKGKNTQAY
jgi:hypothetical protein